MKDSELLALIQQHVFLAVQDTYVPALPIAYVGAAFRAPADKKWLEIVRATNNQSPFLSTGTVYAGSVRLLLHWPADGGGAKEPMELAESIANYFFKSRNMEGVRVDQPALTGDPIKTDTDILYPITFRYRHLTD